jgi:hypothetical protein
MSRTRRLRGAHPAGARLEVEAQEQQVEIGVAGGGDHRLPDIGQLRWGEGAAAVGQATGLVDGQGRVGGDVAGLDRSGEHRPHRGHAALPAGPAVAADATGTGPPGRLVGHLHQLVDGDLVERAVAEELDEEPPVGAIGPPAAGLVPGGYDGHVLGDRLGLGT